MPKRMIAILGTLLLGSGCAALHPLRGVPAAYMPPEYQAETREGKATIDLSLLQRSQSHVYRIEAGDVLAIYAPGLLGLVDTQPDQPRGENPPINLPQNTVDRPSLGFPVTVRGDNTIQIPQLPPIDVYGLTERDVEDRIKQAVQQNGLLANDTQPRIVVSIMRPRTHRVLVYRQESAASPTATMMAGTIDIGRAGKGTSRIVDLRAGENDVAHALAQPGVDGLPGLDASNVIYVIRARNSRGRSPRHSSHEPAPTPVMQGAFGQTGQKTIIRGQNPYSGFGNATRSGQGPFAYMQASQFNLSGRDVAQGSTGPALIEPIPGMSVPNPAANRGHQTTNGRETGYGHSAPHGPEFRDPTRSTRPVVGPNGWQLAPQASAGLGASTVSSQYQPVQYTVPSVPALPVSPSEASQSSTYAPTPSMGSPVVPRYPVNAATAPTMSASPQPVIQTPPPVFQGHSFTPTLTPTPEFIEQNAPVTGHAGTHAPVWQQTLQNFDPTIESNHIIKIPVRLAPGETLDLTEEDVTLYDGDIVFIENRDTDVYFIGGLLGGGQYSLPRDRDLHVLEAVSLAQGQNSTRAGSQGLQSSGGVSVLNRDIVPGASRLIILRQVGCGQTMTVEVDLYKALRYPHENILVQPGDMLILQYTPSEATLAFIQRNVFEGALLGIAAGSFQSGN